MNRTIPLRQRIYEMLMESQYWPPEQMLAYQRSQLAQLLRHAKATVPFYKARLDPVFKKNGEIDWDRWEDIPILKRHHLVEDRDCMLANQLPPGHGKIVELFSSGSTAAPVVASHNSLVKWVSRAAVHRSHRWHDLDWSQNLVVWKGNDELAKWPGGAIKGSWAPNWLDPGRRGKSFFINRFATVDQVMEFILRKQAKHLMGRPQSLQSLALLAEQSGIKIKLDSVTTFGTGPTHDECSDLSRVFGAKIISNYSSEESHKIGISCETGRHYHLNVELNFVELLDDEEKQCQIGQPGRVIITSLFNTAQPLIRYEQGDLAIRGKNCSCGKTLPVLQEVSGRITHLFHLPGGRKIAPLLEDPKFNASFGAKIWQLVQTAPLAVELRYVEADPGAAVNTAYAESIIRRKVHQDVQITFVRLATTPLTAAGKFIQYKSELQNHSGASGAAESMPQPTISASKSNG